MSRDVVERLGNSLVQHGPANDRVYLMKLDRDDLPGIVEDMERLGRERGYSKLFAKVPGDAAAWFLARGFENEARVPRMVRAESAGCFLGKFLDGERAVEERGERIEAVLDLAEAKAPETLGASAAPMDADDVVRLGPDDAEEMAALYDAVFDSYPFPIHDPAFLRRAMEEGDTVFYGIRFGGRLAALASAELDRRWECAEMTDFATRPEMRGKGAAGRLLACMEAGMPDFGISTAYTIARAESHGMNAVFARAGYRHAGTLTNNTHIGGRLESMNVWFKALAAR